MDEDGSYRLVGPGEGSLVLLVSIPVVIAGFIYAGYEATVWRLHPEEFLSYVGSWWLWE